MHPLMQRLAQDHLRLTQLLDLFHNLLERFHAGQEPDYEVFCQMLEYMDSYADIIHHPTEDLIFRRTLERGAEQRDVFEVLMRQHVVVIQMNKRFRQSLDGIVNEEVMRRDEVEAQGRDFVTTMREHMTLEETHAFPIARDWLEAADWDELLVLAPSAADPVFGTPDPERFRGLFKHLYAQAQD